MVYKYIMLCYYIKTSKGYTKELSNFQLSKREEAPMIVFDQNGKMYTNVYPPIGHRGNDYNTRKSGDEDWVRRYLPKWLVIGGNKT